MRKALQHYRKRRNMLEMVKDAYQIVQKDQELNLDGNCVSDLMIGRLLCDIYQDIFPSRTEDIAIYSQFFNEQLEQFTQQ